MNDKRLFWADRIAEQIVFQVDRNHTLKERVSSKGYIIYDEKTPSGQIHIGSGRGWIIHDTVSKALNDKGVKSVFILSSDDMDPMDALPNLENKQYWKQFMGLPFRDIPSPVEGYESYADYYFKDATEKFNEYGINAEFESTGQRYINGDFNDSIKLALDNTNKIQEIFSRFYDSTNVMTDKLPFNPKCEKCGKIGTTKANNWDSQNELLTYKCEPDMVTWAEGCGFEGKISPYNGNGKFPWKIEWAAKWPTVGVLYETAGKDHFSAGGSRDVAMAISNEVFNYPPPLPSTVKKTKEGTFIYKRGEAYEFFLVGGAKMSSSKGQGFSFSGMTKYAPGNLLRFILVRQRPKTAINFDPSTELKKYYDFYEDTERSYYDSLENPDLLKKDKNFNAKRVYELSHIGELQSSRPPSLDFNYGLMVTQLTQSTEEAINRLQEHGKLPNDLHGNNLDKITNKLDFFRSWIRDLAPEDQLIKLKVPVDLKLDRSQKVLLENFVEIISINTDEKSLLHSIKGLISEFDIDIKDFYNLVYNALFGKPKGPRLIPYIVFSGKETIIEHFNKILYEI